MVPPSPLFPSVRDGDRLKYLRGRTGPLTANGTTPSNGRHSAFTQEPAIADRRAPAFRAVETEFFTVYELAAWLGVSPTTIRRLVARRAVPFHRLHGVLRFRRKDIEKHLDATRVNPAGH